MPITSVITESNLMFASSSVFCTRRMWLAFSRTSRALPWFESYADQDRTIRMFLRNAGNEEAMMAPDMIGFMESVV
jgi:hypothetical protein